MTEKPSHAIDYDLRLIADNVPALIFYVDREQRYRFVNQRCQEWHGLGRDELIGKTMKEVLGEPTYPAVQRYVEAALAGEQVSFERSIESDDSTLSWLHVTYVPDVDDEGRVKGFFAAISDITRQTQTEEELKALNEKLGQRVAERTTAAEHRDAELQAILNTAVDGIITIDHRGMIQSANPAANRMFGYRSNELIGENVKILMPAPHNHDHDQYLANYLETGERKIIGIGREVVGKRQDGTTFPMDLAVSEVRLGERRLFTGLVRDISELKVAQARLIHSERLAAIGQTVTGLTHESRNALQRSQACLEMLQEEVGDRPEVVNLVARIQRALDHLNHLYEEVREYAAPIQLDCEPCDLAHVWRATWSDLELARHAKQLEFREETGSVDLVCQADRFAIGQVFRNILENAISASPEQGQILIRSAEAKIDGRPAVEISFRDQGPGIPPKQRERVFEPFFTTKTKGTGLGMAIAQRIVRAHGGRIALADESAPGAEFHVTLPRAQA